MSNITEDTIHGQPSWKFNSSTVNACLSMTGGHLGPVSFKLNQRIIQPYHVAPWAEETTDSDLPPILKVLRGDFFCMPFGGNDTPYSGESHPPHGETANAQWTALGSETVDGKTTFRSVLDLQVRPGKVEKQISLVDGHHALYTRHIISAFKGPMNFGHHSMLKFPETPNSGLLSFSPFSYGQVAPEPFETAESNGNSTLQPGARFSQEELNKVPSISGEPCDLTRYPARHGSEDLVMLVAKPNLDLAWTAVTFPEEGYVWFALKNPQQLPQTILWHSNGGRHYAPWSSRHTRVLGLEEVCSYFHYGLAESVQPNPVSENDSPTYRSFNSSETYSIPYIAAVAEIPENFGRVRDITASSNQAVTLSSENGLTLEVPLHVDFLQQ